ncbi:MAG: thioredoxin [Sandaracinaceae bacterium]
MAGKNVDAVNALNFEEAVLGSQTPVLVDFTATWCSPCRALAPLVDQIADEYVGRAKVVKVDIDDSPTTARKYGIRAVPTVMVFKAGEVVAQQAGLAPKTVLASMLDRNL